MDAFSLRWVYITVNEWIGLHIIGMEAFSARLWEKSIFQERNSDGRQNDGRLDICVYIFNSLVVSMRRHRPLANLPDAGHCSCMRLDG